MRPIRWLPMGFQVYGSSMEPSYPDGARVRVSAWPLALRNPRRGDVVMIRSPAAPQRMELKRVIGLPTEQVSWNGGAIRINGARLDEPYANVAPAPPGDDEWQDRCLRADEYFVAGDNRLHSTDSRRYGPIPRRSITGKLV